ncbi:MAG TPA: phosphate ABC transporter ATP-binding protein [Anaerolineales bacterium]|nr:phosphate ABC transporter ATP-binding protein [Anaerolineales bacterium]
MYLLQEIAHSYQGRCVLTIPELTIPSGQVLAVLGASGAGKSTFLRLLNFLEPPSYGRLFFQGQAYSQQPPPLPVRRQVTMVFQRGLPLQLSVWQNVAYPLQLRGLAADEIAQRVEQILARVGLLALASQSAKRLSGGELQRLALARALVLRPQVLLLDEPTAHLDVKNVQVVEGLLQEEHATRNVTIVLVTHQVAQAKRLAQQVAFVQAGQWLESTPTEQFFQQPQHPASADYLALFGL